MKAIVCVKQVPDTSGKVSVKPDGTLDRASMATITNPDDLNALEAALKLKDATGCEVVVVTMGPPPAEGMLRELLARGADKAVLVSGREFGGSDTYATSQILAAALDTIGLDDDDIVFCGRQAIDGDTAQVGPQLAEKLDVPQVTYVQKFEIADNLKDITVERQLEDGYEVIDIQTPCMLTAIKELNTPRYMSLKGIFDKEKDIMDVWFDSGSSHAAVLEQRDNLESPADLYLEGNDQYRGWFQSSLLTSVATRGRAPYKAVLTHGMILDDESRKMSKSLGNGISPQDVIKQYGADVLRLWVASTDYQTDVHISKDILKQISESYRKIRNTARYILGNISDFNPDTDMVDFDKVLPIDKWALAKLNDLITKVRTSYDNYEFHIVYHSIHNFCVVDMSNFYLDVLKDRLYTEKADSLSRRAAQTVIYVILDAMTRMIAPLLAYTSDEIWKYMPHSSNENAEHVIFNEIPENIAIDVDDKFMAFWDRIHELRDNVKKSLESLIKDKTIKGSLEAKVTLCAGGETLEFLKKAEPELCAAFIVSEVEIVDNGGELEIKPEKAEGEKCERCWAISKTVGQCAEHPTICFRCVQNLK